MQVRAHQQNALGASNPFTELWNQGANTVRNFGIRGLYRGFTWSTLSATPGIVSHIAIYAAMKYKFGYIEHDSFENSGNFNNSYNHDNSDNINNNINNISNNNSKSKTLIPNSLIPMISGLIAESVAVMAYVPSDVVTQHLMLSTVKESKPHLVSNPELHTISQRNVNLNHNHNQNRISVFNILSKIYREDGIQGFWRGTKAAYLTYLPSAGVWWMSYEIYKKLLCQKFVLNNETTINMNNFVGFTFAGIAGGATTALCTNPIDVIRTRIQTQTSDYGQRTITGLLRQMYKHEGLYGFGRGVGGRVVLMVAEGIIFGDFYEILMYLSRIDPHAAVTVSPESD